MTNKRIGRIRNGEMRRDFKRLLTIITGVGEPNYSEVEAIATKYDLYFDDEGNVKEARR